MSHDQEQYLKLHVADQLILLPLMHVKFVLNRPALQAIPNEAPGFEGILNYHGDSVPVYSLGRLVGVKTVTYNLDTPLVLCNLETRLLGLLVSEVEEVVRVTTDAIQSPALLQLPDFVMGVYESQRESMWVVNLHDLIQPGAHTGVVADE